MIKLSTLSFFNTYTFDELTSTDYSRNFFSAAIPYKWEQVANVKLSLLLTDILIKRILITFCKHC